MAFDPHRHHRRSIRLNGYDYTADGSYFITICTQQRGNAFGSVVEGSVLLNSAGIMICNWWHALPSRFTTVFLDAWIVMPDHLHGVITLTTPGGGDRAGGDRAGGERAG
ncbi:MAG TPA: transposase, partial [Roseiflexaceae bacterium]|nr:transposase [Roseiflexaceae bacterium]